MVYNKFKFKQTLSKHKTLIAEMAKTKNISFSQYVKRTGKELALAISECKCQRCGRTAKLQYHHLISNNLKPYIEEWRFRSQRNYWANIIILCRKHHAKLEKNSAPLLCQCISEKSIKKVKKKYDIH